MANFRIQRLAGWAIGVIGAVIVFALVGGLVTLSGVLVPRHLGDLNTVAEAQGTAYKPPADYVADCVDRDAVGPNTINQITTVTKADPQDCGFQVSAWRQIDTLWGALAAVGSIVVIVGLVVLAHGRVQTNLLIVLLIVVMASLAGAWFWPRFNNWLDGWGVIAPLFWRGFAATWAALISFWGAHEAHRQLGHN